MPDILEGLHRDHRNMARLLRALENGVGLVEAAADPDWDLLHGIANYFCDYPDLCHHPKEDAIFRRLRASHPDASASIADLTAEHRDVHARVCRFRDNLQFLFRDSILPRERLVRAGRAFIEGERKHMAGEESTFFPIAERLLTEEDWHAIEADLARESDPLFGAVVEKQFELVRVRLLAWESETRTP